MMRTPIHRFVTCFLSLAALLTLPSCIWKTGTMIEDGGKTHWRPVDEKKIPLWRDDKGKFYAETDVVKCRRHHIVPWNESLLPHLFSDAKEDKPTVRSEPLEGEPPQHCWVELTPGEADRMAIAALLAEKPAHCESMQQDVIILNSDNTFTDASAYWRVPLAWCSRVVVDAPLSLMSLFTFGASNDED